MNALGPQLLFVIIALAAAVAVVLKAPNGPPMHWPRRKRACGHREGAWVCVQSDCDGTHHYYQRATS